jgi:hypothetical protein
MIISEKWKFIFVHNHKTAGDAITYALMPLLGKGDIVTTGRVSQVVRSSLPFSSQATYRELHKHSVAEEIRATLAAGSWDNYYKFSFVRDPVDRAISMYKYALTMRAKRESDSAWRQALFHTPVGARFDPLNWPIVKAVAECNSFSDFLRHEEAMSDMGMRPQWLSVCDSHNGNIILDEIGRYENLQHDFNQILRAIGLPQVRIGRHNVSDEREVLVSEADLALLESRYKGDMVRFGYPARSAC